MNESRHSPREVGEADILEALRITGLLRSGFALATFLVLGEALLLNPARARIAQPYNLMELGACLTVAALTYRDEFARYWREATLALCLFLLSLATLAGVKLDEQAPTFITIIAIMTVTGALMPWEAKWQHALTWGVITAALTDTFAIRPLSPYVGLLGLAMLAISILLQGWQQRCADLEEILKRLNDKNILANQGKSIPQDMAPEPLGHVRNGFKRESAGRF